MARVAVLLILGFIAGILTAAIIIIGSRIYDDSQHFQLHYTGIPYNPTCRTISQDLWDCEHIR